MKYDLKQSRAVPELPTEEMGEAYIIIHCVGSTVEVYREKNVNGANGRSFITLTQVYSVSGNLIEMTRKD